MNANRRIEIRVDLGPWLWFIQNRASSQLAHIFYQPTAPKAYGRLVLRLLYVFHICLFVCGLYVPTYHMHTTYVTYIVTMLLYLVDLTAALSTNVATMSSLA